MVATEAKNAVARQHIQIFFALNIPQIRAFGAHIAAVKANGLECPNVDRIDVLGVQFVVTSFVPLEQSTNV